MFCACSVGAWAQEFVDLGFEGKIRLRFANSLYDYLYEDGLSRYSYIPGYEKHITYLGMENKMECENYLAQDPVIYKHHETHDYIFTLKKEGESATGAPLYSIYSDGTEYLDYSGGYLTDATGLAFTEEHTVVPETGQYYMIWAQARWTFKKEKMGDYSLLAFQKVDDGFVIKSAAGGYIGLGYEVPVVTSSLQDAQHFVVEQVSDPHSIEAVADASIWTSGNTLYINAPSPVATYIYSVNGALVKTLAAGTASTTLPQGTYIVKTGATTAKVIVQ
jgi:hypothetical protein